MKTSIIHFIFLTLFLIGSNEIIAQQQYDFLVISLYNAPLGSNMNISINGEEFTSEDIKKDKGSKDLSNLNPLLRKIKEYQKEGWEVMNFNTVQSAGSSIGIMFFAFLRRKTE